MAGRTAGATTALALAVGLLVGCDDQGSSDPSDGEAGDGQASVATPTPEESGTTGPADEGSPLDGLPAAPTTRSAARLADQLNRVEAVLRDQDAERSDVRRAGRFGQLAARMVAKAPERFERRVFQRLDRRTRVKTRADVEAAALLDAMGPPVSSLPDWRIVEPPPPQELLRHYRRAERRTGVDWSYLAAIHLVETRMGRIRGVSTAGAQGPMQFLPTTWDIYGEGGDINDPRDAILAAARLLRANGAPGDMARALWHYNQSNNYVAAVLRYAEQMQRSERSYYGYWHWQVLYEHVRGTYVLEVGYPDERPRRLVARSER